MISLDELQICLSLFFAPKIHLMTPYPKTLTVKKLIKDELFYYKNELLHSS
jgi:hypothetical protein